MYMYLIFSLLPLHPSLPHPSSSSHYKIIVSTTAPVPSGIADDTLQNFEDSTAAGRQYYVAAAFETNELAPFIIGDNIEREFEDTTFTNPELTAGETYYVFIRLYSLLDVSP